MTKLEYMKKQQDLFTKAIVDEMAVEGGKNKVERQSIYEDDAKGIYYEIRSTYRAFRGMCFATQDLIDVRGKFNARSYLFEDCDGVFYKMHYSVHKSTTTGREHNMYYFTALKNDKLRDFGLYAGDYDHLTLPEKELLLTAEEVLERVELIEHFDHFDDIENE